MNQNNFLDNKQFENLIHNRRKSESPTEVRLVYPRGCYGRPLTNHPFTSRMRKAFRLDTIGESAVKGHIAATAGLYKSRPRNKIAMQTLDLNHRPNCTNIGCENSCDVQLPSILRNFEPFERRNTPANPRIWGAADSLIQEGCLNKEFKNACKVTVQEMTKFKCRLYGKRNSQNEGRASQINNLKSCFFPIERKRNSSANRTVCSPRIEKDEANVTFMKRGTVVKKDTISNTEVNRYVSTAEAGVDHSEEGRLEQNSSQCIFTISPSQNIKGDTPDFKRDYKTGLKFNPSLSKESCTPQAQFTSLKSKREILQLFVIPSALKRRRLQNLLANKRQPSHLFIKS